MLQKKIAFIISKRMYIKFFSNLILHFEKKKYDIYLLFDYTQSREKGKWREFPHLEVYHSYSQNIKKIIFNNFSDLENLININAIEIVISLVNPSFYNLEKKNISRTKWVILQNGFDIFYHSKTINNSDFIFMYSEFFKEKLDYFCKKDKIKLKKENVHVVGNPQFDNINFNKNKLITKFNLTSKKILTFLPWGAGNLYRYENQIKNFIGKYVFCLPYNDGKFYYFRKLFFKLCSKFVFNEIEIIKKISKYCKENNYHFLIKSRSKKIIDSEYQKYCDLILYDDEIIDSTIKQVLYMSDYVISAASTAVGESVFFNCKTINIFNNIFKYDDDILIESSSNNYFDNDGSCKKIDIKELKNKNLDILFNFEFSENSCLEYSEHFYDYHRKQNTCEKIEKILFNKTLNSNV